MEIIALRGNQNEGKSETLNTVYQLMLLFGYQQVPGHFRQLGNPTQKDFTDILEKKGRKVGIATMGDFDVNKKYPQDTVQELLKYLERNGCDKAICACNNGLAIAVNFINGYNHVYLSKTVTVVQSEHRIKNGEDAEKIYKLL